MNPIEEIVASIYQQHCESDGIEPLAKAWDYYQEEFGDIELDSKAEKLVLAAIELGVIAGIESIVNQKEE